MICSSAGNGAAPSEDAVSGALAGMTVTYRPRTAAGGAKEGATEVCRHLEHNESGPLRALLINNKKARRMAGLFPFARAKDKKERERRGRIYSCRMASSAGILTALLAG